MAVVGLGPALGDDMERVTAGALLEAARLPVEIAALAKKCVCGEMPGHRIRARAYSWKKLHDHTSKPLPAHVLQSIQDAFPRTQGELAGLYQTQIQNVHGYLASALPVQELHTFTGPKFYEPDDLSTFEFYNNLNLLKEPLGVFRLIANAAILEDQKEPYKHVYPTISAAVTQALWDALAVEAAADDGYVIPVIVERGLGIWLDRRTVVFDPEHGKPGPAPPDKLRPVKKGPGLATSNQRATNVTNPGT